MTDMTDDLPTRLRHYADLLAQRYLGPWAKDLREAANLLELAFRDGEVLVALSRPEGCEDVHPELVAEDAIQPNWPEYRVVWPEWEEAE